MRFLSDFDMEGRRGECGKFSAHFLKSGLTLSSDEMDKFREVKMPNY